MSLIRRWRLWRAKNEKSFYVLLTYEDGTMWQPGPMTHFAAEVLIIHRMWPETLSRRVVSARIVKP